MAQQERVCRFVIEWRRDKRWFGFTDTSGSIVDLLSERGFDKVKFEPGSVTVATEKEDQKIFVSTSNFGFQVEALREPGDIKDYLEVFYDFVEASGLVDTVKSNTFRLGTKLEILFNPSKDDFNKVKRNFKQKLMKNYIDIEDALGVRTTDYGLNDFSAEYDNGKLNINMGPVTKAEAIARFFNSSLYEQNYKKDAGYYVNLDFYRESVKIKTLEDIKSEVELNISNLNELSVNFEGVFANGR